MLLSARHAPHADLAAPLERGLLVHVPLGVMLAALAAVASVLLADVVAGLSHLRRLKGRARIDDRFARGARGAPVALSANVQTPTAIGYRHPRIIIPVALDGRVDGGEFRAIIAHENAHLARYDDWAKAAQTIVVRALWFVPALWLLARRLDLERELASDERVAAILDPRAYAACLLRLAVDVPGNRLAPAAWRARSQVAIRVERLLRPGRALGRPAGALRLAALAATFALTVLGAGALVPGPAGTAVPVVASGVSGPSTLRRVAEPIRRGVLARATGIRPSAPAGRPHRAEDRPPARPFTLRTAAAARREISVATPVAMVLVDEPGAPCRDCALLRRPVEDGPGRPAGEPRTRAPRRPGVEWFVPLFDPSAGYPRDPDLSGPSWAGLLY